MNVLILGAGLMQIPAILSAKELGYRVCLVDADDKAIAIPKADEFRQIDLKDKEGILEYARALQKGPGLAAVFTAGTDFSASVSYVCQKLNLPSHTFEAASNASIKTRMRKCFFDASVPSPKYFNLDKENFTQEKLKEIASKIDFPLVVKPVDNMGARGCRMVRSFKEFEPAVKTAIQVSRSGNAIVEEYMDGPEYSIDALVYDGTFTVTGFAVRHIKYPPYFIEIGHTMPADLDKSTHDQLISVFALGAKALGLERGAAKADIKFTKKGPMIGEIAGRLSGGYMSGWTYPYSSDLNLTKEALLIACGKEPQSLIKNRRKVDFETSELCKNACKPYELFEVKSNKVSAERAWMSIPGIVEEVKNISDEKIEYVKDFLPRTTVKLNCKVDFPRNNVQKCGNVISLAKDRNDAINAAQKAVSNVFITLKPNTKETDDFLNFYTLDDEENFPPSAFKSLSSQDLEKIQGVILANQKISDCIPDQLKTSDYINEVDWSFNTIEDIARKFDILRPQHPQLDARRFWKALLRGGLQAAVYISDSEK
ncbi:MAG: ATP-grasp domain-containing protein [Treponema sp.]|nr:ATP-grasp domain-containing protein [Treponema sp.]